MGWLILKEQIRPAQWISVLLALIAIIMIAFQTDLSHFPWIALTLSLTFALYGLIRKFANVGSIEGLYFETGAILIPVLIYWNFQSSAFNTAFSLSSPIQMVMIVLSGLVTAVPLVLFSYSAKRLPLRTLGFIQYLSPSLKFVCGLFIFHEALSSDRLMAFILIWIALAWYTFESFLHMRKNKGAKMVVTE
jgi:chloramphenicol-sensitive protein RarD